MPFNRIEFKRSDRIMTDTEAAYVAGLTDGEGSIGIQCRTKDGRDGHVHLSITNTHFGMLHWAAEAVGLGYIVVQARSDPKARETHMYRVSANGLRHLLPQIQPYLIAKRPQCDLALEFLSLIRGKRGIAEADWPRARAIREELSLLNKRGQEGAPEVARCTVEGCRHRSYDQSPYCWRHWLQFGEKQKGTCRHCGGEMELNHPDKQYCSQRCIAAGYYANVERVQMDAEQASREKFPCPVCGVPVDRSKYLGKIYCSDKCQSKDWHSKQPKKTEKRFTRRPPEERTKPKEFQSATGEARRSGRGQVDPYAAACVTCGTEFVTTHHRQKYCSLACRDRHYRDEYYRKKQSEN